MTAATTSRATTPRHRPAGQEIVMFVLFSASFLDTVAATASDRRPAEVWRARSARPANSSWSGIGCAPTNVWSLATCSTSCRTSPVAGLPSLVRDFTALACLISSSTSFLAASLSGFAKRLVLVEVALEAVRGRGDRGGGGRGLLVVHPPDRGSIRKGNVVPYASARCLRFAVWRSHSLRPFMALGEPCMNVSMAVDCLRTVATSALAE